MLFFSHFRSAGMRLLIPLTIATLMLIALPFFAATLANYQNLLVNIPYILFSVVIFLSQPFNQGRTGFVALIMLVAYTIIINQLQSPLTNDEIKLVFSLLAGLLPFNLLQVHIMPDKRLFSRFGALFSCFLLLQIGWAALVYHHFKGSDLSAWWEVYLFAYRNLSPLPLILLVLNLALTCSSASTILKRNHSSDQAVFICLLFSFLTFTFFHYPFISSVAFSIVALLLLINIISCSHELAFIDQLTEIPGRRALDNELKHLGRTFTLAMIDVDHFKKFNDKYGHETGDDVLKLVASLLKQIEGGGKAFRYGGEEFTILFKGKTIEQCLPLLEELREKIAKYKMIIRDHDSRPHSDHAGLKERGQRKKSKSVKVTVSIGVAENYIEHEPESVLKLADNALYEAKNAGRNCVQQAG
ncbi:GGDEF domain-containing protein [Photobacterium leiognathi]|uniref:GGDEF domain-containing protein n=1 Tax=Photobacterium leiognathi TaxID=553611 RepID=UPI00273A01C8|nr:GGDEF domain-containing protein [Photobacterium leiognathi]